MSKSIMGFAGSPGTDVLPMCSMEMQVTCASASSSFEINFSQPDKRSLTADLPHRKTHNQLSFLEMVQDIKTFHCNRIQLITENLAIPYAATATVGEDLPSVNSMIQISRIGP